MSKYSFLDSEQASWRALKIFAGYRLFLAVVLFSVFYFQLPPDFLGSHSSGLYFFSSSFYLLAATALFFVTVKQWEPLEKLITLQLVFDVVMLTLILHASGGVDSGLGSLILVVIAAGGTLVQGRFPLFIAAVAALAILIEVGYTEIVQGSAEYSRAGILGATYFIIAWLARWVSLKMETSESLAAERARDAANLGVLNQHIISRMQIGVLALDEVGRTKMFNRSARTMLGIEGFTPNRQLKELVPILAEQIWMWQHHNPNVFRPFQAKPDLPEVTASATKLDSGEVLVFIENTSAMAQQAQQLKLASLGRLTASIAHEIRNPLGAISHAGELLAEKMDADPATSKLTDIIQRHSQRMNNIIETILQMSRRKEVVPESVVLATWFDKFISEFQDINHLTDEDIELIISAPLAIVVCDPEQLAQVLWNLMDNAFHFSNEQSLPKIKVTVFEHDMEVHIDVVDNGPGVAESVRKSLFEPFHSARNGGTGLGLYLAKALCEANGARLSYLGDELGYSCFRISFGPQSQGSIS